jgi:hypothetical protein
MWQIAWMWSLIPTSVLYWIINLIIVAGAIGLVAGWIGRWIPWFGMYARLLKPIGVILLVIGVWMRGGYDTEMAWRAKVEALEAKVKESEQKSRDANKKLESAVKERERAVAQATASAKNNIRQQAVKIDQECKLDPTVVPLLNDVAKDPTKVKR